MNRIKNLYFFVLIGILISIQSCFDPSKPNYQYFPNMYESLGYETYADCDAFINGIEAQVPVENTVSRGWAPYDFPNTNEGYEEAKISLLSPLDINDENLSYTEYENKCRLESLKYRPKKMYNYALEINKNSLNIESIVYIRILSSK